jgi:CheY-like chemotaxis protein
VLHCGAALLAPNRMRLSRHTSSDQFTAASLTARHRGHFHLSARLLSETSNGDCRFGSVAGKWMEEMAASMANNVSSTHPVGMVVDDDALVRETVAEVMQDVCDLVYQASDGEEGLEVLRSHPDISVIVTDITMPRLDGVGFASEARRMHPEVKVLFVSGLQRPPPSEEFLAKPFAARALVSALHHLLAMT